MPLREHLARLADAGDLLTVSAPVPPHLRAAGVIKAAEPRPVLLERVTGRIGRVAGNLYAGREHVARYLGVAPHEVVSRMAAAIDAPAEPRLIAGAAPCHEEIMRGDDVDLRRVPVLFHCAGDGGPYVTAGVVAARHPKFGQNLDFHRCMQIGPRAFTVRVVPNRHFDRFLRDQGELRVALCVGNGANVMLAAATSVGLGEDELRIAAALEPLQVTRALTSDLLVPAHAEWVIEGTVFLHERDREGPFVDLTETRDGVRQEPVFRVEAVTRRRDAVWQALLPGGLEHKVMMGMPREPTILRAVRQAGVVCLDAVITPGGCSWLHAVVRIRKGAPDDGVRALRAAFSGHGSLKHAFVVDQDIDPADPAQVEWAMATRFQGDRDLVVIGREKGSSLDPSGDPGTSHTCKIGFDLTRPAGAPEGGPGGGEDPFARVTFERVDLSGLLRGAGEHNTDNKTYDKDGA